MFKNGSISNRLQQAADKREAKCAGVRETFGGYTGVNKTAISEFQVWVNNHHNLPEVLLPGESLSDEQINARNNMLIVHRYVRDNDTVEFSTEDLIRMFNAL